MIKYSMNYFVTGATGFVGVHIINLLQREEKVKRVYVLVRNPEKLEKRLNNFDKIKVIEGNIFSIDKIPPETNYIIHLAGLTKTYKRENYYKINRDGVKNIIMKALSLKNLKKFVLISSLAAQGPAIDCNINTSGKLPRPVSNYGKSKLAGEQEALKYKDRLNLVIIRPPAVYGERDHDFLEEFRLLKKGRSINIRYKPRERM